MNKETQRIITHVDPQGTGLPTELIHRNGGIELLEPNVMYAVPLNPPPMLDARELVITVTGCAHTGKSTVMGIIEKALKEAGYANVTQGNLGDEPKIGFDPLIVQEAIKRVDKVTIREQSAMRNH